MNDAGIRLLREAADQYCIKQGAHEEDVQYACRIIYTCTALMAIASLWDSEEYEQNRAVSIVHLKQRIDQILENYLRLIPEIKELMQNDQHQITEEIYRCMNNSGLFYHQDKHILPAVLYNAKYENIAFLRDSTLKNKCRISGIGQFRISRDEESDHTKAFRMFALNSINLSDYWKNLCCNAAWKKHAVADMEYLNMNFQKFSQYWVLHPFDHCVSVCRDRHPLGQHSYYLYHKESDGIYFSGLPDWMHENGECFQACNAAQKAVRCPIENTYSVDGDVVILHRKFPYPKHEISLLNIYSWPLFSVTGLNRFYRCFAKEVFFCIKDMFAIEGYGFIEREQVN